ncbi:DUF3181 family protein [Microcoleus sp. FACHB-1515]|uniref:DUF3181 family protein n=1 Tax=Cyanophyceae TaxID=3028117 RepID=UPI001684198B|nr:DUF3181 family protein [Microcoleus sp. FACHB-1515]MBD2091265.1 DUF3181 family protein [Microcoleus sp. FACHB-1515]
MAYSSTSEAIEALAAEIGENVYMDVAKWHLYLRDAHLHTMLAERFYPLLQSGSFSRSQVEETLGSITVSLGGGKREVPLADLIPSSSQNQLVNLLQDYQRNL